MQSIIEFEFNEHLKIAQATMKSIGDSLEIAANLCIDSLKNGGKILIFGNGGSAADAQHVAAELVGRYKSERKGLAAIALTTDSSALTCITNDYSYDYVFSRQVEALANNKDVVIGIAASGTTPYVLGGIKCIDGNKYSETLLFKTINEHPTLEMILYRSNYFPNRNELNKLLYKFDITKNVWELTF